MIGRTIKEIMKTVNEMNNVYEIINRPDCEQSVVIYINEHQFYVGTSYREFIKNLKEEYIDSFVNEIQICMFCGNQKTIFKDEFGDYNTIEIYIA